MSSYGDRPESARKRTRKVRDGFEDSDVADVNERDSPTNYDIKKRSTASNDSRLFDIMFPREYEAQFATAIFELGLKHSSPKILVPLMPIDCALSTEHIKSHLQKYRIHRQRSKEEFQLFYEKYIKDAFHAWENRRGWEHTGSNSSGSSNSNQHSHQLRNNASIINDSTASSLLNLRNNVFPPTALSSSSTSSSSSSHPLLADISNPLGATAATLLLTPQQQQEQLAKKMKQLASLQALLQQSTAILSDWKMLGKDLLERSQEVRQELVQAVGLVEDYDLTQMILVHNNNNNSNNSHNNHAMINHQQQEQQQEVVYHGYNPLGGGGGQEQRQQGGSNSSSSMMTMVQMMEEVAATAADERGGNINENDDEPQIIIDGPPMEDGRRREEQVGGIQHHHQPRLTLQLSLAESKNDE